MMQAIANQNDSDAMDGPADSTKFLIFHLDSADYAMPVDFVREIISSVEPAPVPSAPPYVIGVINLRGRILPLIV